MHTLKNVLQNNTIKKYYCIVADRVFIYINIVHQVLS